MTHYDPAERCHSYDPYDPYDPGHTTPLRPYDPGSYDLATTLLRPCYDPLRPLRPTTRQGSEERALAQAHCTVDPTILVVLTAAHENRPPQHKTLP